ncbi:hypothetical protein J1N35_033783 [Gossypium stocksii]|uniref:CRIB domain-containing protein n=1 Tax=Gossypium stocksii TaxID=47602 RepID=A0A9D3ZPM0_9ROSI|nr:hypothetical protein J1N35_033783 [Gossypium stocksii]
MEIGNPTDVKHVAHIGLDSSSDTAPSWMNEFKTGLDSTAKPIRKSRVSNPTFISTCSSQGTFSLNLPYFPLYIMNVSKMMNAWIIHNL